MVLQIWTVACMGPEVAGNVKGSTNGAKIYSIRQGWQMFGSEKVLQLQKATKLNLEMFFIVNN